MQGRSVVAAFVVLTLAARGESHIVAVPGAADIAEPVFQTVPDDLADSSHDALAPDVRP